MVEICWLTVDLRGESSSQVSHECHFHDASAGGVGLTAVQYALHKGALVYATAGREETCRSFQAFQNALDSLDVLMLEAIIEDG